MKSLLTAISFLTIFPINLKDVSDDDFKNSLRYYPVVGCLLGILFYLVSLLNLNLEIRAVLILFLWILLTGCFHLDGVADIFDALGAVKNREKAFEIMQDSRIGAVGTVAIVFTLFAKFILIKNSVIYFPYLLIIAPMGGRYSINFLAKRLEYAKESGLGKFIVDNTDFETFLISSLFLLISVIIINVSLIVVLLLFYLFLIFLSNFYYKKFGGVTGDMFGCSVEMSELFILCAGIIIN